MKKVKEVRRYCKYCRKHTLHKVSQLKLTRKRGALKLSSRKFERIMKGYGGFPRPKTMKSSRHGVKTTKRVTLLYKCSECNRITPSIGIKAKKFSFVEK
ncbi:MAG: 50S ribosomal protein L44e [Candidatus Nanoarchaeia archaeon]|nr:50S ribosomal protein L44e [Candidatus Haiyanarchaeum thermophilum]MCW1302931.1 50S ribosomal protein L44e [Candidatus Haiyanarchaeum thermophilum]MCW1303608.1 50S ribosomal protein L44e [Candidatus Haiyanarchaeum thermophilum]MCW1306290.1 50S ribosomal protein L44e [Candidatus Haiyanarchaeum thermophilum]MCW1307200.1 50S ribosomal protein L44e [Candidatus Haiyanarchaeum thermophilum]